MKYFLLKIKNLLLFIIFVIGGIFFFANNSHAVSANWVYNPATCPTNDIIVFPGQYCPNGKMICGADGGNATCYNTAVLSAPASSATSATAYGSLTNGGWMANCYVEKDSVEPFCDNSGAFWCGANSTCLNTNHKETICATSTWGSASCGDNCVSGYQDCDATPTICEVQTGSPRATNTVWATSCGSACANNYLDCNGGGAGGVDGDGCEIHVGGTCTTGGLTGTYGATCNGLEGNCVVGIQNFQTGVEALFSTTSPLLWGTQYGAGNLLQLMKNGVTTSTFVITNTGAVGIGTSTVASSAALEINSTNGGLLLPRLDPNNISSPVAGLIVYSTSDNKVKYYNGSSWQDFGGITGSGTGHYLTIWTGGSTLSTTTIYVDDSGKIGFGMFSPQFEVDVSGTVHTSGDVMVSGTLATDNTTTLAAMNGAVLVGTTTNAGALKFRVNGKSGALEYCDINGENCFDPTAGWMTPVTQMVSTTVTTTGNVVTSTLKGYAAVDELCHERLAGSRICTTDDILYIVKHSNLTTWGTGGLDGYWIAAGPPGYLSNANDCTGFTSASNIVLGRWWRFDSDGGGEGWMTPCNVAKPIACCK